GLEVKLQSDLEHEEDEADLREPYENRRRLRDENLAHEVRCEGPEETGPQEKAGQDLPGHVRLAETPYDPSHDPGRRQDCDELKQKVEHQMLRLSADGGFLGQEQRQPPDSHVTHPQGHRSRGRKHSPFPGSIAGPGHVAIPGFSAIWVTEGTERNLLCALRVRPARATAAARRRAPARSSTGRSTQESSSVPASPPSEAEDGLYRSRRSPPRRGATA